MKEFLLALWTVLVLCVVLLAVYWLPGVLERLPKT